MSQSTADWLHQLQIPKQALILSFEEVGIADIPLVGGKNASLGEMLQQLMSKGVNVPAGFATTASAYRYFINKAGLEQQLRSLFSDLDVEDVNNLRACGRQARALILNTPFPPELEDAIADAYLQLCQRYDNAALCEVAPESREECIRRSSDTDVAVRSSATAEDLRDASFAGQR